MKVKDIELGYSYVNCCLFDRSEFTIYVFIPKFLNLKINTEELIPVENIEKEDSKVLGLENNTNISDYNIYKYYKIFSDLTCFSIDEYTPNKYYRKVLIDLKNKNILKLA